MLILNDSKKIQMMMLVVIYCILYFINALSIVDSVEFMSVDPSSIIGSINHLFVDPVYNMNGSYHSRVYGWTYFSLNFLALIPFKLAGAEPVVVNTVVRLLLFMVGIGLLLVMFSLMRAMVGGVAASIAAIYFMTNPEAVHFFVTIHPESTGALFYLLALYSLRKITTGEGDDRKNYVSALVFLTLSAFSKQPFALVSFFIFLGFAYWYMTTSGRTLVSELRSRDFIKKAVYTIVFVLFISFLIHPYLYLSFRESIGYQLRPLSHSSGDLSNIISPWAMQVSGSPLVVVNLLLLLLLPFQRLLKISGFFIYSLLASVFLTFLFMYMQKQFIVINYLYPLYPIYLLNVVYALGVIYEFSTMGGRSRYIAIGLVLSLMVVVLPHIALNLTKAVHFVYKRVLLEGLTTKNVVWDYLQELPADAKIYYTPAAAMPDVYKENGCHSWRECNTIEGIQKYSPDYIVVSWKYQYFNAKMLRAYMDSQDFELVKNVQSTTGVDFYCGRKYIGNTKLSRFYDSISPVKAVGNISDCVSGIEKLITINRNRDISGLDISIYKHKT